MPAAAILAQAANGDILDDDTVPRFNSGDVLAYLQDFSSDLVAERHRLVLPIAHKIDIGAAHTASTDFYEYVVFIRRADLDLLFLDI